MLLNLKTIHKPQTLEGAAQLLGEEGTYPLYGGVALQRNPRPEVAAAVDLAHLGLDFVRDSDNSLRLGTMLTLEQVRQACDERRAESPKLGAVADVLAREQPETLRNTMTLGDLLAERDSHSMALTLFLALGAVLKRFDLDMHFTTAAWLATRRDVSRYLIGQLRIPRRPARTAITIEQVGRTPADAPIVGAVALVEVYNDSQPAHTILALCGVDSAPVRQPDAARVMDDRGDIDAALDRLVLDPPGDHWGSSEYRAEMARVLSRRALARAWAEINEG
jgi:aerobic carbon-monoxide dehydrogenase medium subunit